MTINPVGSQSIPYASSPQPSRPPAQSKTESDTVQLSAAAQQAAGDVDHDGDSH